MIQLSTWEMVSHQVGKYQTTDFVMSTLSQVKIPLSQIDLFYSGKGKEFDNQSLEQCFRRFDIKRSLSKKGCPQDNAVAEARFKSIKTEFIQERPFNSMEQLEQAFEAYVYWYNHKRLHSSSGYLSPVECRKRNTP